MAGLGLLDGVADGDADGGHAVDDACPGVGPALGKDDEGTGGEVVGFPARGELHGPAVGEEFVRGADAQIALADTKPRGDVRRGGHLGVGPALPVALLAETSHVGAERRLLGVLARGGPYDTDALAGLGDVGAGSGPALQHALGDQQLLRPADDVLAHTALVADLGPRRQTVSRFPDPLGDPPS